MQIVFRVEASNQIGSGHVIRCLTLAQELQNTEKDIAIHFICRDLPGNMIGYIEKKGFPVYVLPYPEELKQSPAIKLPDHIDWLHDQQAEEALAVGAILRKIIDKNHLSNIDWLIVDHYSIDSRWETKQRLYVNKIMVIDDTADRQHDCDLLLDQNLHENMEERYNGLVPENCIKLLGPEYAQLRPEFREARKNLRQRDGTVRRILVFMGGADPTNETAKALEAISMLNRPDIVTDVVVGSSNPHQAEIEAICDKMANTNFYCQVDNMAELMVKADLAIGGGGSTTWERCCVGLPALIIHVAENQVLGYIEWLNECERGTVLLGSALNVKRNDIYLELNNILSKPERLKNISMAKLIKNVSSNIEEIIDILVDKRI